MIRQAFIEDFGTIYDIINDAAIAYKGIIPADRWHEPYMSEEELSEQIQDGVRFFCYTNENDIIGVMGIQDKKEVNLIRHAYVRTKLRNQGVGSELLKYLIVESDKPILKAHGKMHHGQSDFIRNMVFLRCQRRKRIFSLKNTGKYLKGK